MMKHPVRDRILIFIGAVLFVAAAAALVLTTLNIIPAEFIARAVAFVQGGLVRKVIAWAVALVLVLFALCLVGIILPGRSKRKQPFATIDGENGAVNISIKAIESLVNKCLQAHPELKVVSSSIFSDGDSVRITLHITLLEDISIPLAVSALQKEIRQYVQSCAGVEIDDVRVFVDGTTANEAQQAASPYRVATAASIAQPLSEKKEEPVSASPVVEPDATQEPVTQTFEPTETGESAQESEKQPEPEEEPTQNDDESVAQDPSAAQL